MLQVALIMQDQFTSDFTRQLSTSRIISDETLEVILIEDLHLPTLASTVTDLKRLL